MAELLVVMLIVGILAVVAIPTFLGQRVKGQDACAKAMAKEMFTATKAYQTEHNTLSGLTIADLHDTEESIVTSSGGNDCHAVGVGDGASSGECDTASTPGVVRFCVSSQSAGGTVFAVAELDGGTIYRSCTVPTGQSVPHGGCRGAGGLLGTW
jgi:type IV pilus assembly protein PilA